MLATAKLLFAESIVLLMGVNIFRLMRLLSPIERSNLNAFRESISRHDFRRLRSLIKQRKATVSYSTLGLSININIEDDFPQAKLRVDNEKLKSFIEKINREVKETVELKAYKVFCGSAEKIKDYIAPTIVGLDTIKEAIALQLFAKEPVHILLLGDIGTGKTEMLKSAAGLAPVSVFGSASGADGTVLSVSAAGKNMRMGLLPSANEGLCAIDELNTIKIKDYPQLYNAMEKGFVAYDSPRRHMHFNAKVKVLASATPKTGQLVGRITDILKQQIPFEPELMTKFHLCFIIRRPSMDEFKDITRTIVKDHNKEVKKEDIDFIRGYIGYAESMSVDFPKMLEEEIVTLATELKKNEIRYLVSITPRTIRGLIRLAKASARMELRKEVTEKDIRKVRTILKKSLEVV